MQRILFVVGVFALLIGCNWFFSLPNQERSDLTVAVIMVVVLVGGIALHLRINRRRY
jgi:FtsH-binding integral membrane protein